MEVAMWLSSLQYANLVPIEHNEPESSQSENLVGKSAGLSFESQDLPFFNKCSALMRQVPLIVFVLFH